MPKTASVRHIAHHASVQLPMKVTTDEEDMVIDGLDAPVQLSKKLKQAEKRQAFLQKLEPSLKQFSRSQARKQPSDGLDSLHIGIDEETVLERETLSSGTETGPVSRSLGRRLKRKAKEQLGGGLGDLHKAIEIMDEANLKPAKPGAIEKGSSSTLSKSQRKRVLELERIRHPLILNNSEFSSNPFQTIRTHAQNTMLRKATAA